ncbi:protein S40-7-like [Phragmites australis]|uniref:protein S40-7-like n=1 Tax=Phragmites australis TaxID=29695 RepID=UPI002D793607|nr:protein S40-7-like [Phragmites australis]
MDRTRHKSSLSSERFIGSFLPSAAAGDQTASAAFELDEDDLFAAGSGSPEPPQPARRPLILSSIRTGNPRPLPRLRRPPEGILDALPERRRSPPLSSSSASSSSTSSPAAAPPRMIPAVPRPAPAPHMPQSAPVNVPAARLRKPAVVAMMDEAEDEDDEEMLPPHEMVARARARESPMTTFSMLEGAGRTLKGRDLRQVRNAVWRQTGFLD